jgi:hypothetical protein
VVAGGGSSTSMRPPPAGPSGDADASVSALSRLRVFSPCYAFADAKAVRHRTDFKISGAHTATCRGFFHLKVRYGTVPTFTGLARNVVMEVL